MKNPVIKFVNMTTSEYYPKWDILLNGHKIGYIETERNHRGVEKTATLFGGLHRFRHDSQEDTRWNILDMLKHGQLSTDPVEMAAIIAAEDAKIEAMQVVDTVSHDSGNYSLIVATRRNGEKNYTIRSIEKLDYAPKLTVYNLAVKRIDINTRETGGYASTDEEAAEMLTRMLEAVKARKAFLAIIADYEGGH